MQYTFQFTWLGKKVQMFHENRMGVVIEKEPDVVCVYGTTEDNAHILCAVPLCHPRYLKGVEYTIEFCSDERAKITVGDVVRIIIDFANKTCSNSKGIPNYGSESWGHDVSVVWEESRF